MARKAGVSIGTVSRVLNGGNKENWKSTVRRAAQVRRIAQEMGYRPSWRGRAFASGKTHTIGLIHQAFDPLQLGEAWHDILRELIDQLRARNYGVQFLPVGEEKEDLLACRAVISERRFDGCMVSKYLTPEIEEALRETDMPAVMINAEADASWSQVQLDDRGGAMAMTRHLIQQGHRRIAFMTDETGTMRHFSLRRRLEGVYAAMAEAGLGQPIEAHRKEISAALEELMALSAPPTAVVTYHDTTAVTLLQACWRKGIGVPTDLSVATFNDSTATRMSIPPLTTMRLPGAIVARRAATQLLERMAQGPEWVPERLILPEELIVRESTGPAAK
ncbi:MAG: LacI family DNA-binding transcriptional regulator [Phycisphaeraceae bacterium]